MASTATGLAWFTSCVVAAVFLSVILLGTRAVLARRDKSVAPAAVVLTASLVGASISLLALALL